MKKLLTCTVTVLLATMAISFAASHEDMMMEKEKAAWQAFKDKKPDDFKKVVSPEIVAIYPEYISNMEKELSDMQKWDMKSFEIGDYKITSTAPNVAISSYTVKIEGTYDGKDGSGTYNAGSVWEKKNGKWWAIFHTNVKQAAAQ